MAKNILELDFVIRAWKNSLSHNRFLMSISMITIVEATVSHLEELQAIKQEPKDFRK